MAQGSDSPQNQISIRKRGELLVLAIPLPDGHEVELHWGQKEALAVAVHLIELAGQGEPSPGSLFEPSPLLAASNPPMEFQRSDTGQFVIAFQPADLRPITIQLSPDRARELRDAISAALGD